MNNYKMLSLIEAKHAVDNALELLPALSEHLEELDEEYGCDKPAGWDDIIGAAIELLKFTDLSLCDYAGFEFKR